MNPLSDYENQPEPELRLPPLSPQEEAALAGPLDGDLSATAETRQLSSGLSTDELKKTAVQNEANRTEKFRDHFEKLAVVTLYFTWLAFILIGATWV